MKIQFLKSTSPTIASIGLKPESVTSSTDAPSCSIPVPLDVNDTRKNGSADVPDVSCENGQHQENDDEINQPGEVQSTLRLLMSRRVNCPSLVWVRDEGKYTRA
nr:E3 ubiquitin-protein ligase UPL1 [Ipomoea trifida]